MVSASEKVKICALVMICVIILRRRRRRRNSRRSPSMDLTDSVSGDSSDEDTPPKKKHRTTTRRGLSALLDNNSNLGTAPAEKSSVYSSRVSSVMGSMRLGQGQLSMAGVTGSLKVPPQADSDVEEDEAELFAKKRTRKMQRLPSGRAASKKVKTPTKKAQPYKVQLIDLDSDSAGSEEENKEQLGAAACPLTPPPPPTPPEHISLARTRKPRQKRALKNAVKELDRAQLLSRSHSAEDDSDVSIVEVTSSPLPDNQRSKPVMVKVRSRSGIQRFNIKAGDPFTNIIRAMASHEFVPVETVVMFLGDQTVEPYDTPTSLGLSIADIIECHILKPGEVAHSSQADAIMEDEPDVLKLKVQGKNAKASLIVPVRRNEPLGKLMKRYAGSQNVSLESLKFEFDGEEISPQNTPDELELEENFCIDVIAC